MTKPISPDEVATTKLKNIPDEVIEAFNEIIAQNFSRSCSNFKQKDVVKLIMIRLVAIDRQTIFDNGWLDVEDIYREAGWKVEYDKPAYNEDYEPNFTFIKK